MGVAPNGTTTDITSSANYRWTVEEDATKVSVPGKAADKSNYSFSFHTSYMPVVAAGRKGTEPKSGAVADPDVARLYAQDFPTICPSTSTCIDPQKRYYVSVAATGFQMGGAPVVFSGNGAAATATVYVNEYNLPTAQLSVFAFEDNFPINGAPDLPEEQGLAGFTVTLLEAGGTYGQSGGAVTQDAFANPLGTTYNADGSVKKKGDGIILTGPDGTALIKNLFPAKYTVLVAPPVGSDWHQTSTIEGTLGSDAWVKNNEPTFFQEFGPPGHHVFMGFTRSGYIAKNGNVPVLNGGKTLTGRIVNTHYSRPPVYTFYNAAPVPECWVGLNEPNGGRALYATACTKDSKFSIPNVPDGNYEVVVWDAPLDMIIATTAITVNNASASELGDLPVASWFGRYQGRVFQDIDGSGLPFFDQPFSRPYIEVNPVTGIEKEVTKEYAIGDLKPAFGEGIASNIRFRDGSIYQSTITKQDGTFAFTEVFPFFNWMVAEIDYARFKASGATIVTDNGGVVDAAANAAALGWNYTGQFGSNDPALAYSPWTRLNPQAQPENGGKAYRTENCADSDGQCAILLEGMQTFLSQTNHIEWGKQPYGFNENGGIAGIVHYAITRAEDDPRFAAAENWEPGIPRVQVNLYLDCDGDGKPDQPTNDGSGACTNLSSNGYVYNKPDVDNYPFCWSDDDSAANTALCPQGKVKGPEDIKRSLPLTDAIFGYGDVFKWGAPGAGMTAADQTQTGLGTTDAWDDKLPVGCPDATPYSVPSTGEPLDCFDGLRNFNQTRPSVFDGGYAFGRVAGQPELPMFIGTEGKGTYIVEAMAPPGYLHQGNGDKNVVFGDALQASTQALPFACVGQELDVPQFLTLFPGEDNPNYAPGRKWNKCDMKAVPLLPGTNPAPDFFMFTEAPVAGHGVGFILDDTATEFNQFAPTFGEKYSPPHLPVSIQDWTGREISRVYSDQFGSYNFLVPSSFTINPPYPSGVMPSMIVACMNHPGPIADPSDPSKTVIDPYFNRNYTQFCYTLQYLPGKTTYLDTPVLPISAFASVDKNPLDCECADGTPTIYSATNGDNGPWVPAGGGTLTLVAQGKKDVVNPAYDPTVLWPAPAVLSTGYSVATGADDIRLKKTIQRDFGFGTEPGTVSLNNVPLALASGSSWSDGLLNVVVPSGATTGQLNIKRGGPTGKVSTVGLTVHVGTLLRNSPPKKVNLAGSNGAYKTIQAAVEAAAEGDLITIAPGTYSEFVIMDKHVSLQGWGAGSVTINAAKANAGSLNDWRDLLAKKVDPRCGTPGGSTNTANCPVGTPIDPDTGKPTLVPGNNRRFDILPGQTIGFNAANNEPILFGAEEAPGILVVGRGLPTIVPPGQFSGCLPSLFGRRIDGLTITGSDSGGGIFANGFACDLEVSNNRVVANYGTYGGGIRIGHTDLTSLGGADNLTPQYTDAFNRNPRIHHNWVAQNGATEAGGAGGVTLGTGSNNYSVNNNYVCGNFSMADGGGLSHLGRSVGPNTIANNEFIFNQTFNQAADPTGGGLFIGGQLPLVGLTSPGTGSVTINANHIAGNQAGAGAGGGMSFSRTLNGDAIVVTNNIIANNVTAYAGGGVALAATGTGVHLSNNTVASNLSTATNRQSFGPSGATQPSLPQIAGIAMLDTTSPAPQLVNNIVWGNRSMIYLIDGTTTGLFNPGSVIGAPSATESFSDLGRVGNAGPDFAPLNSVLTTGGVNDHVTASSTNQFVAAASNTLFTKKNSFVSITDPDQPVVLAADGLVQLLSALTFDETGNFINVIFKPLTLWENATTTADAANIGALRADYHIPQASPAADSGQAPTGSNFVPTTDFDSQARPFNTAYDIGADEYLTPPSLVLQPAPTVAFGNRSVNTTGTQTLTVSNVGNITANLGAPTLSGADANQFAVLANGCPADLNAGQSCSLTLGFTPTSNGAKLATLSVNSSNVGAASVSLTGTGVTPIYSITPLGRNFGSQGVGTSSQPFQFTLTNTALSQGELWLTGNPTLSGTNASQFQAAYRAGDTCAAGTHLPIGGSCTFSVVFTPTTLGCKGTAVLGVCLLPNTTVDVPKASGSGNSPGVWGVGVAAMNRTVSPAGTLTFGTVARGNTSAAQVVTVTNTGFVAVPVTSITFTGANAGNWIQSNTCGSSIAVGSSCAISVQFKPTTGGTAGARNAVLQIIDGVGTTTRTVNGTAS